MVPVQMSLQDMAFTHWLTTNTVLVRNDIRLGVILLQQL